MRDSHPFISALMVAFGMRGIVDDADKQFESAAEISKVAVQVCSDTASVIRATDEAGVFSDAG